MIDVPPASPLSEPSIPLGSRKGENRASLSLLRSSRFRENYKQKE
jgi:hypothetical protein